MLNLFRYPLKNDEILRKKKKLRKELINQENLTKKNILILSGSTVGYIKDILEIFLLYNGIFPIFHEGTYNRFYEDIVFDIEALKQFKPDFVYIHTSVRNVINIPEINDNEDAVLSKLNDEISRYKAVWNGIFKRFECAVIQNNFEMPDKRSLGNMDAYSHMGLRNFIDRLNMRIYEYARENRNFYVNDLNYISAEYGLLKWHNAQHWHMYKYAMDLYAIPLLCQNIANIIKSILGKNKKAVIVDLDNTLWGGVVGDDGSENIEIGNETPKSEAYAMFQQYLKKLKGRGVLLCVCSKNDLEIAKKAFENPKMILRFDDFVIFKANWNDKASNIIEIARELNLSSDSFVFIDDNPAERELVLKNIKGIAVNDSNEIETFINFIDKNGFFEAISVTGEDLNRNEYYKENLSRAYESTQFTDYNAYLDSLEMEYAFDTLNKNNLERVAQLVNKTNQFNLTVKRMTESELRNIMDKSHLNITVKLKDKFGDNGLISVFSGSILVLDKPNAFKNAHQKLNVLNIDIWLMSCRVFKRNVEYKLFDYILERCRENDIKEIRGYYVPTEKNAIARGFYEELGFKKNNMGIWIYKIGDDGKWMK